MDSYEGLKSPPYFEQLSFFATGAFAGLCALPLETVWQPKPPTAHLRTHAAALLYRPGIRFWIFDITRSTIQQSQAPIPIWAQGGLSGASGGLVEGIVHSYLQSKRPPIQETLLHSSKLFFCFGTYTFLATAYAESLPPRPFWKCWLMGASAGALGSGIIAMVQGVRGPALWKGAIPRGALTIGTVISVQVTSCAELLQRIEA